MNLMEIRKSFHKIPEIAYEEKKTQKLIMQYLNQLGVDFIKTAETGLIAIWRGTSFERKFTLFRADMDGLPIPEETGVEYSSTFPGLMHACGHDVHMTILLGLIEKIRNENLKQNFLFLFQPAEEGGGGAELALKDLSNFDIATAWALHVTDEYELGTVATKPGILFASSFEIDSIFTGKSSHIAFYSKGKDAIVGATSLIDKLYSIPQNDFVARFGMIEGGRVRNAVADKCNLHGTVRTEKWEKTEQLMEKIKKMGEQIASEIGLKYTQKTGSRYPEVIVSESLFEKFSSFQKVHLAEMKYTGEDFGFISKRYPSVLFWLGCRLPGLPEVGLHHPKFLPPDSTIQAGIEVFWNVAKSNIG
ncbi:MAG: amidohydrolase [Candidatus Riflebacteria bacterium]|nr:amidohydrolase [Candidatus Riflebacteria bacterium]